MIKSKNIFYTRNVLLSTGQFTIEGVIKADLEEFYGTAPLGLTVGLKESQNENINKDSKYLEKLNFNEEILGFSQEKFDNLVYSVTDSQTATAFSIAYLKYKASKDGFDEKDIYKFVKKEYRRENNYTKIICNILNGGKHSHNNLSFCEFMIIPQGNDTREDIKIASEIYLDLEKIIISELGVDNLYIGREGGFSPLLSDVELAITLIEKAIRRRNKGKCNIAIDIAANNFGKQSYKDNFSYTVNGKKYDTQKLVEYYVYLIEKYPNITYLEDPFHENDIEGWEQIMKRIGDKVLLVADDLTISKLSNLKKYKGCYNACILKINQAGNLSGLIKSYEFCIKNKIRTIISQRSGESDSNIIAHLALGLGSDYLKAGAPARERITKYNELIRITDKR